MVIITKVKYQIVKEVKNIKMYLYYWIRYILHIFNLNILIDFLIRTVLIKLFLFNNNSIQTLIN